MKGDGFCDLAGLLQTGQEPKMARDMAGEMAGGHFSRGVPKWPRSGQANGRTGRKSPNFSWPAICLAIFRPFSNTPGKWPLAISPAISRPFLVLDPFPILQQASLVARRVGKKSKKFEMICEAVDNLFLAKVVSLPQVSLS